MAKRRVFMWRRPSWPPRCVASPAARQAPSSYVYQIKPPLAPCRLLAASPVRDTYAHAPPGQATLIKVTAFASVDAPWKTGTPQSHLVRARYDPNWSMRNGKHVVVGQ